ncbi:RNase adaptor protein RapZ [Bowdeniella nasicola]|uniref:RNase adaptor protein RapZ n=1 Tax=Bowdeniella nasicola TaxID=208480 RepID=A0A1Q5Q1F8_9ACTO|nr:RNase adapter RapZ [Bowdeniella nasicola]OKL53704.1 RNase adaptor protein RapZ [Bowdeniella nasicola]
MSDDRPRTPPPTVPHGIPVLDEEAALPPAERPEIIIISGMSGAGRTRAAAALEDLDWYVIDNLPPRMLMPLAVMMRTGDAIHRLAAVVDVRSGEFFAELVNVLDELRRNSIDYRIVFLDADDSELVRRFETVRRPHPLQGDGRIMDGIEAERTVLEQMLLRADEVIDTTDLSVHELAHKMREIVATDDANRPLHITVMSFGFKYGLPLDADHVVDMRFLANPYWVTELRHLTGRDKEVSDYVLGLPQAREFISNYVETLTPILDGYQNELKPYVTIAVGCTGGKHRSVATTEEISRQLRKAGFAVRTIHRDLGKE